MVTLDHPRLSIWHVLGRIRIRMIDIQVWDVAGTMTFYTLLSLVPLAVAIVSVISLLGIEEETIPAFDNLVVEIFPTIDPHPYSQAIYAMAQNGGGMLWLVVGLGTSLLSASNGVAALHRALHHVYDTREGRPFLRFRSMVVLETIVLTLLAVVVLGMLVFGGDLSRRIGQLVGISQTTFDTWNLVKWPLLLMIGMLTVSAVYHLFPNVRFRRYRILTLGSVSSVLTLFLTALAVGRLAGYITRYAEILSVLNGLMGILLLVWVANMVLISGAILDAEFLRARQIAMGIPAWQHIELEPQATHSLKFLARDARKAEEVSRVVSDCARTGEAVSIERTPRIVESTHICAVNPSRWARRHLQ